MNHALSILAMLGALALAGCDKPTVVNVPAAPPAAPGPAGPAGATGATGATGAAAPAPPPDTASAPTK